MQHAVAAVVETVLGVFATYDIAPRMFRHHFEHELNAWTFFNPGVMLVDLQRWRAENMTSKVESLVRHFLGWRIDTVALNLAFVDKIDLLHLEWNVQGLSTDTNWTEFELALRTAKILHWHGGEKPWDPDRPKEFAVNDHLYRAYDCRRPCSGLC
eukprot:UN2622